MQDPEAKEQNRRLAEINPHLLLEGEAPRLIDEWQLAPNLWDAVRFEVDRRGEFNQFILTGSTTPGLDFSFSHSGTGRISSMVMRPMSSFESQDSNESVSLLDLFDGEREIGALGELDFQTLQYLICRGGWPIAIGRNEKVALTQAYDYYDSIVNSDISIVDGVSKNPYRVERLMRSYARFVSTEAKLEEIRKDMLANEDESLSRDTISTYITALQNVFFIENLPAWSPNLHSKTAIRTSDTRHFVDPSIAVAALGLGPVDLVNDLETMGLLFKSMVVRDLRVYAEALDGKVFIFRQKDGLECDAVIHRRNGSYGLVEVKLGNSSIDQAAESLIKIKGRIDTDRMKEPSFMMVVVGTGKAYTRKDGVHVVPVGCLRP